jgi:CheY-like chemotaxis protein
MSKVMLVEDDATMRSLLKTLLELEGYQVISNSGGKSEHILTMLDAEQPDYLIMDIYLRKINGIELLGQIRQKTDPTKLRIMMTSGMDMKDQCLSAGADAFLLKPYMPDELLKWLHEVE